MKRIDDYSSVYRQAVRNTLLRLLDDFGSAKVKEGNITIPLNVYLKAYLDDINMYIDEPQCVTVFTEWDKKGKPTKAKLYKTRAAARQEKVISKVVNLIEELI